MDGSFHPAQGIVGIASISEILPELLLFDGGGYLDQSYSLFLSI